MTNAELANLCPVPQYLVHGEIHSRNHHHHVQEGLGLIPVPCILKMKLVPPPLRRSSYVSSSFGLYCSACLGILFVSILCMCCSHFSWYCFISFTQTQISNFMKIHPVGAEFFHVDRQTDSLDEVSVTFRNFVN